jgi:hypothetical protein
MTSICNRNKNIRLSSVCGWPPVAILFTSWLVTSVL